MNSHQNRNVHSARRRLLAGLAAGALIASGLVMAPTSVAANEPASGVCKPQEAPSTSGWTSYSDLRRVLDRIERTSKGRVSVESIATTHRGRDVLAARVGTGERVALITGAIHGNERTGVEALLSILTNLGTSNNPEVVALLKEVTLVAIPMLNPDGVELNRRINDISWADTVAQFPQLSGARPAW